MSGPEDKQMVSWATGAMNVWNVLSSYNLLPKQQERSSNVAVATVAT